MSSPAVDRPSRAIWASGEAYDPYVGRRSRSVADEFISWLRVPAESRWVDVGCGTGAVTEAILKQAAPRSVEGIDPSEAYLDRARQANPDDRARFRRGQAGELPLNDGSADAAVSGLAINFVDDPEAALREMSRVTRAGGQVACYVWDYAGRMQLMRYFWNAAVELDPAAAELDEGRRFPICQPLALAGLFELARLKGIAVRAVDVWTVFRDFDDYWDPILGAQGPAPSYAMSLSETKRTALRERIRAALPYALDGSIPLMARAWAARGVV